jgi:hypothetical protein
MTYEEFRDHITSKCLYDAIYEDQEGREIIVMTVLNAYSMASKLEKREWVGLTDEDLLQIQENVRALGGKISLLRSLSIDIEAKLKEKNT